MMDASAGFSLGAAGEVVWIFWTLRGPNYVHTTREGMRTRKIDPLKMPLQCRMGIDIATP